MTTNEGCPGTTFRLKLIKIGINPQGGTMMVRTALLFVLIVLFIGGTAVSGYAVTSEPEPPAGAPSTSMPPPTSAGEQHEGKGMSPAGKKDEGNKAQEQKAIKHTEAAITQGKAGNAEGLRKHAETALKIAQGAEKRHSEAHVKEGIQHLKLAVDEGRKGNADEGTKHAEEALTHLKQE